MLITKKQKLANIILLASCYAEGVRFEDLGFNPEALSAVIVASEVPPAKMIGFLSSCSCGPALSAALLEVYGGSVWTTSKALRKLTTAVEEASTFEAIQVLSSAVIEGPAACFDAAGPALARPMAEMLRGLAQDGFFQLSSRQNLCAAIVRKAGVGGIVSRSEYFAGAQAATWAGSNATVVIPACQTTRLILAGDVRVQSASLRRGPLLEAALKAGASRRAAAAAASCTGSGGGAWWGGSHTGAGAAGSGDQSVATVAAPGGNSSALPLCAPHTPTPGRVFRAASSSGAISVAGNIVSM